MCGLINTNYSPRASEQISIFYANVRNIIPKLNNLIIHANAENPDFIVLTELWINTHDKH